MYRHAFESKSNLAPYDHRVRMCELAFGLGNMTEQQRRTEKVKVLDVERAVVRAAWDRHGSRRRSQTRPRGRPRGGAAEGSDAVVVIVSRRADCPPRRPTALGVVRGALAEGAEDPADEPVRVHRVRRADIPVQVPDDDRRGTQRVRCDDVRAHHPERHPL